MVFSSVVFLFFFLPFTLLFYFLAGKKSKNLLLLAASLVFYGFGEPRQIGVMLISILLNYLLGIAMGKIQAQNAQRKGILILGIMFNLSLLIFYKYAPFALGLAAQLGLPVSSYSVTLPIGISFFTFQGLSYLIDLYRKEIPPQNNLVTLALYISFFPQLIAGPIIRYQDINSQLVQRKTTLAGFSTGIRRFSVGLAKKVMIANTLGEIADQVFGATPVQNTIPSIWLGAICYAFQIYFDFSGYSDMAIGLGKLFGFSFPENFNYPYCSLSITEFWRRWHISLSGWFRDYVYIPLGGNRRGSVWLHLMIVFFLTGLWHGASLTFILWGLYHGVWIISEKAFHKKFPNFKIPKWMRWGFTMLIVLFGWILFRSPTPGYAIRYIGVGLGIFPTEAAGFSVFYYLHLKTIFILLFAAIASFPLLPSMKKRLKRPLLSKVLQNTAAIFLLTGSILSVVTATYNPFLYFRF